MFLRTFCQALCFLTDFLSEPLRCKCVKALWHNMGSQETAAVWIMNLQYVPEQLSVRQKWNVPQEWDITQHFCLQSSPLLRLIPRVCDLRDLEVVQISKCSTSAQCSVITSHLLSVLAVYTASSLIHSVPISSWLQHRLDVCASSICLSNRVQ